MEGAEEHVREAHDDFVKSTHSSGNSNARFHVPGIDEIKLCNRALTDYEWEEKPTGAYPYGWRGICEECYFIFEQIDKGKE